MHSAAAMAWYLSGAKLGPWEAYLARKLTPELDIADPIDVPEITWLAIDHDIVLPEFARSLVGDQRPPRVSMFTTGQLTTSLLGRLAGDGRRGFVPPGLQRTMLLSGITRQVSERNRISVSAVLASQQFSHSMLDLTEFDGGLRPVDFFAANRDLSTGAGLHLGFASEIAPRLRLNASYQSRVNMDELASVRGVHGYSADLDVPSRVRMALDMRANDQTLFTVAVSQVFYSEVGVFPSRALPARFIALLGDSTSPTLAWKDLTVYSVGMQWRHKSDLEVSIDFHTRSQPTPTAASLSNALEDSLGQHSVLMGIGKPIGDRARFDVSATYAPPEFAFGGNVLGVVSDRLDQAVEVAARFNYRF
ncbi:MAG: hypothetical protein ACPGJE_02455 [Wenzhouxiangellaceae bacterium]